MHLFGDDDENYQENATAGPSAAAGQSVMSCLHDGDVTPWQQLLCNSCTMFLYPTAADRLAWRQLIAPVYTKRWVQKPA